MTNDPDEKFVSALTSFLDALEEWGFEDNAERAAATGTAERGEVMSHWTPPQDMIVAFDYANDGSWSSEVIAERNGDGSITIHSVHQYKTTIQGEVIPPSSVASSSASQPVPSEE